MHTARHTWLHDNVNFKNPSDALVAKLLITLQLPATSVNLFLAVIRNPSFNSGEVTFRRANDIHAYVDRYRQERLARRPDNARMIGGIPYLVLHLVIERIGEEMVIEEELITNVPRRLYISSNWSIDAHKCDWTCIHHTSRRTLRALANVHTEVTTLARSILSRRLLLKNPKLAEQPSWLRGANVQELRVRFEKHSGDFHPFLRWLSSHLPNLRSLSVERHIPEEEWGTCHIPRTLVEVPLSLTLSALRILLTSYNKLTLLCFYNSISRMRNLSVLSFACREITETELDEAESHQLASISPPSSLKKLMVTLEHDGAAREHNGAGGRKAKLFSWLLQARSHYNLEELTLRCAGRASDFASVLPSTLPRLRGLDVDFHVRNRDQSRDIGELIRACSSLEKLLVTRTPTCPLPETLQVLCIDNSQHCSLKDYSDEQLADYLNDIINSGEVPNLRRVYYVHKLDNSFPRSLAICNDFNVEFSSWSAFLPESDTALYHLTI